MDPAFAKALDDAPDYTALFRLVKRLVESQLRKSRAGMMLGLASLGLSPSGFFGGYFVVGSNAIVLNRDVLNYVKLKEPTWHNAYAFHVLLHEYLHTLGYFREDEVRPIAHELSVRALGHDHKATRIAAAMTPGESGETPASATPESADRGVADKPDPDTGDPAAFFRELVFPKFGFAPARRPEIEIVKGFDPDATSYIG